MTPEKYQYRLRDWDKAAAEGKTLAPYLHHAQQDPARTSSTATTASHRVPVIDSDRMVAFSKRDGDDTIIVVVTLDLFRAA